jgi:formylmethanofuran--tetrahydromethanopterin N-formyltransferase
MFINGVEIIDTFAEGFRFYGTRFIITAENLTWALEAGRKATGFATSIIACGCEGDIEGEVRDTPDGRPGVSVLLFASTAQELERQVFNRIGQCVMTCPTTACYNGLPEKNTITVGGKLRYFGDGWQSSKLFGQIRYWRIPVMDGEFLVEEKFGYTGEASTANFLILGEDKEGTLKAAQEAVKAIRNIPGVILPFPGGMTRSGSKVGSVYSFLKASTNTAYCPSLRGRLNTSLPPDVNCVLEIVVCGLNEEAVRKALKAGIPAACLPKIKAVTAGNYGGKLGDFKVYLHQLLN